VYRKNKQYIRSEELSSCASFDGRYIKYLFGRKLGKLFFLVVSIGALLWISFTIYAVGSTLSVILDELKAIKHTALDD
jgi:hypothetical protein